MRRRRAPCTFGGPSRPERSEDGEPPRALERLGAPIRRRARRRAVYVTNAGEPRSKTRVILLENTPSRLSPIPRTRSGAGQSHAELGVVDADFAARQPALAALCRVAVSGLALAGPERRERAAIHLDGEPGVEVKAPLGVAKLGFSVRTAMVGAWRLLRAS